MTLSTRSDTAHTAALEGISTEHLFTPEQFQQDVDYYRAQWSYVKKKYKLNMPFLVLSYPAKASALLSNAA